MSRAAQGAAPVPAGDPLEALERMARRLDALHNRGERVLYASGSLVHLCGEFGGTAATAEQRAWRRVRKAAQQAEAEGRAALLQRGRPDDGMDYLAVGLGRRARP